MASYHTSFDYLGKNSAEQGYIIAAFEPDESFKDAFLDMDQISEDYYDGTKKFLYGTRYNSTAAINVTLIKMDGTDWSVNDNRKAFRWLTGARTASWLDLRQGDKIKYSFLGTVKSPQQYKLDGRVVGISFEFASITPWAYSEEQIFDRSIQQALFVADDGALVKDPIKEMCVNEDGVLCNGAIPGPGACFCVDEDGVLYVKDIIIAQIDNKSDDLYSYIYLDIEYINETCEWIEIKRELDVNMQSRLDGLSEQILNDFAVKIEEHIERNAEGEYVFKSTAGADLMLSDLCKQYLKLKNEQYEITRVKNLHNGDIIDITGQQFIVAYTKNQLTGELANQERIFGDDFNFVWPRLAPGVNNLVIEGNGNGTVRFSYRYPMKVGDCAMDIDVYGGDTICDCTENIPSYDVIRWQDITGIPTSIAGFGITDAYTQEQADQKIADAVENKADKATTLAGYGINDAYTESEVNEKLEDINEKIDNIEISGGSGGSVIIDEDKLNEMLEDILT